MALAVDDRPRLVARKMTFVHDSGNTSQTDLSGIAAPEPESISFTPRPLPGSDLSAEAVDSAVAALSRHFGHDADHIERIVCTLSPTALGISRRQQLRDLQLTVRRRNSDPAFVAHFNVTKAFGYGSTIGEAFAECMNDMQYRLRLFLDEGDRLGPAFRQEAEELERFLAGVH